LGVEPFLRQRGRSFVTNTLLDIKGGGRHDVAAPAPRDQDEPGKLVEAKEGTMFEQIAARLMGRLGGVFGDDALSDAAFDVLDERVAPLIAAIRLKLLERVGGAPPAELKDELAKIGLALTEPQLLAVWRATFVAIAAERARSAKPELVAIDGGAGA